MFRAMCGIVHKSSFNIFMRLVLSVILAFGLCLPVFATPISAYADDSLDSVEDSDTEPEEPVIPEIPNVDGKLVIGIDPGHGGDDSGALGNDVVEAEANWAIAQALVKELRTYTDVEVVLTQDNTQNLTRQERILSGIDQGADIVISIHCNSADGAPSANGCEAWVPNSSEWLYEETHVTGTNLGASILSELSDLGLNNRGVKTRDCTDGETYPNDGGPCDWYGINYWARWNGICGIIIEHAFLSNASDAALLSDPVWLEKFGIADATGIAKYYGLSKSSDGDLGDEEGGSGSDGTPDAGEGSGDGTEEDSGNEGSGPGSAGSGNGSDSNEDGTGSDGSDIPTPDDPTEDPVADLEKVGSAVLTNFAYRYNFDIMGESRTTPAAMAAWYKSKGKMYPSSTYEKYGAATIEEFCMILFEEAQAEGVRAEVAFAQSMNETGWLRFGGQVKAEQCNFCGLGATDGGAAGADFSTYGEDGVRMGLRAQIQHLKAYASTAALINECIDPRFKYVTRGCAPTVQDLSGRWASNLAYGSSLASLISDLLRDALQQDGKTDVRIDLVDVPTELLDDASLVVYVDGVAHNLTVKDSTGIVTVSGTNPRSVVLYEMNTANTGNPHSVYPTHMYVWLLTSNNGVYTTQRYYGLDDMLRYAGSSIRISGTKGIRMITGISEALKTALVGDGVLGYSLVETGTLLAWSDRIDGDTLVLSLDVANKGTAYVAGSKDPVFGKSGGVESYTNVLVGFSSAEQYKRDLAMRAYAILSDAAGNRITVYGGTVHRSIEYIARQNATTFAEGTEAYRFVHGIIDACGE